MASMMWVHIFVVLCVAFLFSEAAVYQGKTDNPNNDGCVVGSEKYKPGEFWYQPGICARYECTSNQGDFEGASCGVESGPEECAISEGDNSKIYPECCPQVICPEEDRV